MGLIINKDFISKCNFKGKGGKESQILSCFTNNLIKENGELFDCIDDDTKEKYELKKQKNLQWLDPRKFYNLSNDDKKIIMIFVLYDDSSGLCDTIATIRLGDFVKIAYMEEHLKSAKNYAKKFPKDQIKSSIKIRDFIKDNEDSVEILWKSK